MLIQRAASGDKDKAQNLLVEAIDMYRTIGMPKHLVMAHDLLEKPQGGTHPETIN
jgi:hypothetical protein